MPTAFSRLLCSEPAVRDAFRPHALSALWWRAILFLHGKPEPSLLVSEAERVTCIADGFRFYGVLYASLAVAMGAIGATLLPLSLYAGGALLMAAVYLGASASLGRVGAEAYRRGEASATVLLAGFLVALIGFLCAFLAGISVWADRAGMVPPTVNLAVTAGVLVFGVGSYLIELVYLLVTRPDVSV